MVEIGIVNHLKQQMEVKRREMIRSANVHGFASQETVMYSQELDRLINAYFDLYMNGKSVSIPALDFTN